jgi:hypothetical protein
MFGRNAAGELEVISNYDIRTPVMDDVQQVREAALGPYACEHILQVCKWGRLPRWPYPLLSDLLDFFFIVVGPGTKTAEAFSLYRRTEARCRNECNLMAHLSQGLSKWHKWVPVAGAWLRSKQHFHDVNSLLPRPYESCRLQRGS